MVRVERMTIEDKAMEARMKELGLPLDYGSFAGAIAEGIKARQNEIGMTNYKLAKETGLSQTTIGAIKSGGNVSFRTLFRICNALNREVLYIMADGYRRHFKMPELVESFTVLVCAMDNWYERRASER